MVDTKPEVILLDFTPIESSIYEALVYASQNIYVHHSRWNRTTHSVRELCCKLNYDWGNTLEEMREFMIKTKIDEIEQQKNRISQHKGLKASYERGLKDRQNVTDHWYVQTAITFVAN